MNRWLSLRWFEPNTCHHLHKRPVTCLNGGFVGRLPFLILCHPGSSRAAL
jgi:hypothetical protein